MVMAAGPAAAAEEVAEKTEFDLVITDVDASKRIAIIKVVRGLTSLGLKEAKDAVTNLPFTILEGKTKAECEEALKTLEEGQIREGVVKNIADFGAFLDIGGVDGLLHLS